MKGLAYGLALLLALCGLWGCLVPFCAGMGARGNQARGKRGQSEGHGSPRKNRKGGNVTGVDGQCGARKRNGQPCTKAAGWGTDHVGYGACKLHGGSTPKHQRAVQKVMAGEAVEMYGLPVDVAPMEALLDELQRTAGHVAWLGSVVQALEAGEVVGVVGEEGLDVRTGTTHHPEGAPSVWLKLYQAERKHLTDVAATCIKCGIAERQVRVAEQQGQMLAQVIQAILKDLKVPAAKARPVVRKHLQGLPAAGATVSGGAA